jgi:hypothetical protein
MKTNAGALIVPSPSTSAATNATLDRDIRDIKSPVAIPNPWLWVWVALGALALAAAVYALIRHWRKSRVAVRPPAIVIPPHVRARNKLREALGLIGKPKPFCTLVSDTLRVYLEERFSFRAPDRTTEEFLDELQSSALLALAQKQTLGDFLMRCDLVKFARYEPGEPELRDLLDAALRLVEETAPSTALPGGTTTAPSADPAAAAPSTP